LATYDSAAASSSPDNTIALNSFLDLNAAPNARAELVPVPRVNADLDGIDQSALLGRADYS
jgi:hypothetical protein